MISPNADTFTSAAATSGKPRFIQRCSHCHSAEVVRDAWASWSVERQEWALGQAFDHAYCETCETDCEIEAVPEEPAD